MAEPSTELAEIETEMGVPGSRYWREPERQERYRELVDAREAHRAAPAARGPSPELRQLEEMMRDPKSAYWRGPRTDELQARYRALIEGAPPAGETHPRQAQAQAQEEEPAPVGSEDLGALLDAVREDFGFPEGLETEDEAEELELQAELGRVRDGAAAIVGALGNQAGRDLVEDFDGLSDGARAACFAALARFEPGYVVNANAGELAAFRADRSCGGRELVAHWGSEAPRRLGTAMTAFNEARDLMGDEDRAEFDAWWRDLTPRTRQIILWRLGEPR